MEKTELLTDSRLDATRNIKIKVGRGKSYKGLLLSGLKGALGNKLPHQSYALVVVFWGIRG